MVRMRLLNIVAWGKLLVFTLFLTGCGNEFAARSAQVTNATEGNIAKLTARIMEDYQYSRHPLDDEMAGKFLNRYIEALDDQHLNFLQSDLDEFAGYRSSLDKLTKAGNTTPAQVIFSRFTHRLEQHVAYVTELLKTEQFDFTGHDRYQAEREKAAWPKDLNEARELWREQLRYQYLQEQLSNKKPEEIVDTLQKRYNSVLRSAKDLGPEGVLQIYLTALTNAYDPHSDYLGRASFEELNIAMKLSLVGIGAELSTEDGYPTIRRILPGPAARTHQLQAGDRVVAVAQEGKEPVDVVGMPLTKVVELIRGPQGTRVRLTVSPKNAADPSVRKSVTLTREEIKLEDQEAKAKLVEVPNAQGGIARVGVINLPSFYEDMDAKGRADHKSTTADVAKLLKKLEQEQVSGVILDLRENGGGSLEEAIGLTGLFIKRGPVVQARDAKGKVTVYADKNSSVLYDGPLVVLTSRMSASASEIVAGALQDYGRALIVGDTSTFGKGTVQSVIELDPVMRQLNLSHAYNAGALTVTIQKFYRPGGGSTQLKGVIPDVVLPSLSNVAELGESSLYNPLPWDQIRPLKFEKQNRVEPFVAELRRRSAQRMATEKEFAYLRQDIERVKKTLNEKSISLNEAERRQEKQELAASMDARKQDLQARNEDHHKTFEITLSNAGRPGLPPPMATTNSLAASNSRRGNSQTNISDLFADGENLGGDITLNETEHILTDWISLSAHEPVLSTQR